MEILTLEVLKQVSANANANNAAGMKAYMKNKFEFYGLKTPERRNISRSILKQIKLTSLNEVEKVVRQIWSLEQREFHYIAIETYAFYKKLWTEDSINLIEELTLTKSWWDSVDAICSNLLDVYFTKFPQKIKPITSKWNKSENIWLQRNSIMFQKFFNEKTDVELLTKYILNCSHSKEFFIQKAIGWALREYAYTNPNWVRNFVINNDLPKLSKREASKHL